MTFRWNEVPSKTARFWDPSANNGKGGEFEQLPLSDLQLVRRPDQCKFEDVLRALCHVVSELVEIEERRSQVSSNPPEDQL